MALMARLQFGDNMAGLYAKEFLVRDCHLHFTRHHKHFQPDTDARCETVEVVVVAPGREDLTLYEWYTEKGTQSGRLVFDLQSIAGGDSEIKFLEFEDAYCYSLAEEYHIDAQKRRCIRLSFVAESLTINETEFRNLYSNNR